MATKAASFNAKRATQLTVWLPNAPGQLAKLGRALRKAKVNLSAISVHDGSEVSAVRMVADDQKKAADAVIDAGLHYAVRNVLLVTAPNMPGVLGEIGSRMQKASVNVDYTYASCHPAAPEALVVLAVNDIKAAVHALQ